jgi:hypothetical protein
MRRLLTIAALDSQGQERQPVGHFAGALTMVACRAELRRCSTCV